MSKYTNILNTGGSLLLQIVIGFVSIKFKMLPFKYIDAVNKYDFRIAFIPLMARLFASKDLYSMNFKPLGACALMSVATQISLAILCFALPYKEKFKTFLGLFLPAVYINYVVIGIPLFDAVWGSENNAITSVIIMSNDLIIVPVYQVLTTIYSMMMRNKALSDSDTPKEKNHNQDYPEDHLEHFQESNYTRSYHWYYMVINYP
jgi:predicted permease